MKNSIKIVLVALAAIVLVSTVAVLTPRTIRAKTSTTVTISPTADRIPWASTCVLPTPNSGAVNTTCQTATVPAGYEFVVQSVTFDANEILDLNLPLTPVWVPRVETTGGGSSMRWTTQVPDVIGLPSPTDFYGFDISSPTALYADPGTTPTCLLLTYDANYGGTGGASCTLSGYLVKLEWAHSPAE